MRTHRRYPDGQAARGCPWRRECSAGCTCIARAVSSWQWRRASCKHACVGPFQCTWCTFRCVSWGAVPAYAWQWGMQVGMYRLIRKRDPAWMTGDRVFMLAPTAEEKAAGAHRALPGHGSREPRCWDCFAGCRQLSTTGLAENAVWRSGAKHGGTHGTLQTNPSLCACRCV